MTKPQPKRGSIALYLILLILVLSLMATLRRCSGTCSDNQAAGGDTLDVAIEYSPMSLYRYNDTLGGFNYDLLRLVAQSQGFSIKLHPLTTVAAAMEGLEQGRFDIIVADMARSASLMQRASFTEPTYLDRQVLVQRLDSVTGKPAVTSQLDLVGKTVYVAGDSQAVERLRNLSKEIGDTINIVIDSIYGGEQLYMLTALGQIPMAVVNSATARSLASDYPGVDASLGISFTQFQGWVVADGNDDLLERLNNGIKQIKTGDEYRRLLRRYSKVATPAK